MRKELIEYQQQCLKDYQANNKKQSKGQIVFVGDSLVAFYNLKKYFGRELPLLNRGIAGMSSHFLYQNLKDLVLGLEPDQVFILIGTNDIELGVSEREICQIILEIISKIKEEIIFTDIYLLSLLPVSEHPNYAPTVKNRTNQIIRRINQVLASFSGVNFVNLFDTLSDDSGQLADDDTRDGLHLSPKGYNKISQILEMYIR